jgi:hypothetical protein
LSGNLEARRANGLLGYGVNVRTEVPPSRRGLHRLVLVGDQIWSLGDDESSFDIAFEYVIIAGSPEAEV